MSAAPVTPARRRSQLALVVDGQQRVIQRGWAGQHGDPLGRNEFHHAVDVEDRHRHHRCATDERRNQPGLVPERMEVRVDHQIAIALAQVGQLTPFRVQAKILAVIHHHALGPAGGTRRIDDVGDVVTGHVARERRTAGKEVGFQVHDRHAAGCGVVQAEESLLHKHRLGPTAADDVGRFLRLEPCVDRHQHAACGQQPERRDHPLRGVGRPDRDPLPLFDTELGECASGATDPLDNLGVIEAQRTVDDRLGIAEAVRRAQDHLGDGPPWPARLIRSHR